MKNLNRRKFLGIGWTTLLGSLISRKTFSIGIDSEKKVRGITPLILTTDLFHFCNDPDDHFDLASVFALAYIGSVDLQGILIDYPKKNQLVLDPNPDVMGVAQMNYYTGLVVPAVVGSPYQMKERNDVQAYAGKIELQSINWIINTLKKSPSRATIHIAGTARNIAVAMKKEPVLFKEKCKGIYLNAGNACVGEQAPECNVLYDVSAYAAIFDAPCPVYWLPCFNEKNSIEPGGVNASTYTFLQKDILPYLPKKLQNYFLFMFGRKLSHQWFSYLNSEPEQELLTQVGGDTRWMWCTAGFFHAADRKVTRDGKIVSASSTENSVFSFKSIEVSCNDKGKTTWKPDSSSKNRYILHINDVANYKKAMTIALKNLLLQLPV